MKKHLTIICSLACLICFITVLLGCDQSADKPKSPKVVRKKIHSPETQKAPAELVLCFCASDWEVDSKKVWKPDGSLTEAESMDALKTHAAELFDNLGSDWVPVTQAATRHRKWWQFWR